MKQIQVASMGTDLLVQKEGSEESFLPFSSWDSKGYSLPEQIRHPSGIPPPTTQRYLEQKIPFYLLEYP